MNKYHSFFACIKRMVAEVLSVCMVKTMWSIPVKADSTNDFTHVINDSLDCIDSYEFKEENIIAG